MPPCQTKRRTTVTAPTGRQDRAILRRIATRAMLERGLLPDFSAEVTAQLTTPQTVAATGATRDADASGVRDLTDLLWASIDNDDSRDLDQLTVANAGPDDTVRVLVAVADVDALVKAGSAIDQHAQHNT